MLQISKQINLRTQIIPAAASCRTAFPASLERSRVRSAQNRLSKTLFRLTSIAIQIDDFQAIERNAKRFPVDPKIRKLIK